MAYLLDTNTLIQAKNEYYAFDLCPGFWDWLDLAHQREAVFSIEPVKKEILEGEDALSDWAKARPDGFFLPVDAAATAKMPQVVNWVQTADFKEAARRDFLAKADPLLIAYSLAHGHTLVTHEVHIDGERRKVKIPTVCNALGVECARTFEMLRAQSASFVLQPGSELL
jgi:hypothetical protein